MRYLQDAKRCTTSEYLSLTGSLRYIAEPGRLAKSANDNAQLTAASPIAKGAQDTGDRTMNAGATAFMRAAGGADVALMKLLVENKADPKLANKNGLTALSVASA